MIHQYNVTGATYMDISMTTLVHWTYGKASTLNATRKPRRDGTQINIKPNRHTPCTIWKKILGEYYLMYQYPLLAHRSTTKVEKYPQTYHTKYNQTPPPFGPLEQDRNYLREEKTLSRMRVDTSHHKEITQANTNMGNYNSLQTTPYRHRYREKRHMYLNQLTQGIWTHQRRKRPHLPMQQRRQQL